MMTKKLVPALAFALSLPFAAFAQETGASTPDHGPATTNSGTAVPGNANTPTGGSGSADTGSSDSMKMKDGKRMKKHSAKSSTSSADTDTKPDQNPATK